MLTDFMGREECRTFVLGDQVSYSFISLLFIVRSKNLLFQKFWIKTKLSQRALLLSVFFFYNFIITNITYIPTWAGRVRRRHDWPFWQRQHWGVASTSAFEQGGSSSTCHKQKLCQSQLPPMTNKTVHIPQPQNAIGSCQFKEITKILQDYRKTSES